MVSAASTSLVQFSARRAAQSPFRLSGSWNVSESIKSAIAWQVEKISDLLEDDAPLPVDRLRDEAAGLQAVLAEAARLERIGEADEEDAPAK